MKFFTLHDRSGGKQFISVVTGALARAYADTDFYDYGFSFDYKWNSEKREWEKTGVAPELVNIIGMSVSGNTMQYFHFELALREMMDKEKIPYIDKGETEVLVDPKHLPAIWELKLK